MLQGLKTFGLEQKQKFTCFSICPVFHSDVRHPGVLIHQDVAAVLGVYSLHHFAVKEPG